MLAPGTILQERYRIVGKLGEGGMGAVYEAIDQRLDATVALKETLFADERLRRQFEREARLLARLHHPALPRVSDHFAEGGGEFLVMQYVPGDDLAGIIAQRGGSFPQEQVAMWADQLLDALDYLHTQDPQIVHRDIKPQNLKLTGRGQIVLLDFGLAKGQVHEFSRVTASASIFGYTPNYAPLEQVQGLGTDPRSDLYALAATLYHLLTGIKPPDALTRAASLVNGQTDPLQMANEVNPAVSPTFAAVLRRALAQNRDQRFASAAEMRKSLHSDSAETIGLGGDAATLLFPQARTQVAVANPTVAERATVPSGETTVVRTVQPPPRRRILPWAIAAAVLLVGVVGAGAFYAFEQIKTTQVREQPTPSPVTTVEIAQPSPSAAGGESKEPVKSNTEQVKSLNTSKEAKKQATPKRKEKTDEQQAADDAEDRSAETRDNPPVEPPEVPYRPGGEAPNRSAPRPYPIIRTQTLPNGNKVMIMPNGTRVVTYPDGSTRVFPAPGQRPRRRQP